MIHALIPVFLMAAPQASADSYDLPGDRVIWREEFETDTVGSFPRRMQRESGDFEVVEIGGHRRLRTVGGGVVTFTLPEVLPNRFSIEVEYRSPRAGGPVEIDTNTDDKPVEGACQLGSLRHTSFVRCGEKRSAASTKLPDGGSTHIRFTVDGLRVTGYLNETRLPDLPNAVIPRTRKIRLRLPAGTEGAPTLVSGIRIAEGGKMLRR
jgi:hypothetical protein